MNISDYEKRLENIEEITEPKRSELLEIFAKEVERKVWNTSQEADEASRLVKRARELKIPLTHDEIDAALKGLMVCGEIVPKR